MSDPVSPMLLLVHNTVGPVVMLFLHVTNVFTLIAPLLPCTPACGEATSRIYQVSQMSSLTATKRPACRFVPRPIP